MWVKGALAIPQEFCKNEETILKIFRKYYSTDCLDASGFLNYVTLLYCNFQVKILFCVMASGGLYSLIYITIHSP